MSDLEKSEYVEIAEFRDGNKKSYFTATALAVVAAIVIGSIALIGVQNFNSAHSMLPQQMNLAQKPALDFSLKSTSVRKTSGKQPLQTGCVNIYGSNYLKFPETDALVICNTMGIDTATIDSYGFSPSSPNHGITYVETGENAWLTVFIGKDFTGASLVIPPKQFIDLTFAKIGASPDQYWNDCVMSLKVQGGKASKKLGNAIMYQVHHNQILPDDTCVILYGANPLSGPDTTGIVACADPRQQRWDFTRPMIDNWGYELKKYSAGVSYVRVGKAVTLTLYTSAFPGQSLFNLTIPSGQNRDLTTVPLGPGQSGTWNDLPISFSLDYPPKLNTDDAPVG
jgi:hypothetical protein